MIPVPIFHLPREIVVVPRNFSFGHRTSVSQSMWTVEEIARAVGGKIRKWGPPGSISIDTRTLQPNNWFFAMTGPNFNGHDFITPELSAAKGCVGVVGNRVPTNWEMGFVEVEGNTLNSLMAMGSYARKARFDGNLIGVTGTVGKTTTKSMIALALENLSNSVYQSPGNWNNNIGVALSLIGVPRNAAVAVLEMGMSHKGEIWELARMAKPSIRVILNVGASHLQNFESLEGIAMAKSEILMEAMPGDICVLNGDDPLVRRLPVPNGVRKVSFVLFLPFHVIAHLIST